MEDNEDCGLSLRFQPIFMPCEERVFGYECLLRVVDEVFGELPPAVFLPIARKYRAFMSRLERWAFYSLEKIDAALVRQGFEYTMLSMNLDGKCLREYEFAERVRAALQKTDLSCRVGFEFDKSVFTEADAVVRDTLEKLRAAGVLIVLDDADASVVGKCDGAAMIKIGQRVTSRLTGGEGAADVKKIIAYARSIGADVAALGVENERQEQCLLALGCDKLQGYYYSRPLDLSYETAAPRPHPHRFSEDDVLDILIGALLCEQKKEDEGKQDYGWIRLAEDGMIRRSGAYEVPSKLIEDVSFEPSLKRRKR